MQLVTDKPTGILSTSFVCMGVVADAGKDYACLLDLNDGKLYLEEIHWGRGRILESATFHEVNNDKEWKELYSFVSAKTTIFSPRKIKGILRVHKLYTYNRTYEGSSDYHKRKDQGIL